MPESAIAGEKKGAFRFRREERLKGRNEIREVFAHGGKFNCRYGNAGAKLFLLNNNLGRNRICFTFSRGFGNAVERNRARRLGREAYRLLRNRLAGGYDLVLLVYAPAKTPETLAFRISQLEFLFAKAGLLT